MNVGLVPFGIAAVGETGERIEVATDKAHAKSGPTFHEAQEITPEYEAKVREHCGPETASERGSGEGRTVPARRQEDAGG